MSSAMKFGKAASKYMTGHDAARAVGTSVLRHGKDRSKAKKDESKTNDGSTQQASGQSSTAEECFEDSAESEQHAGYY